MAGRSQAGEGHRLTADVTCAGTCGAALWNCTISVHIGRYWERERDRGYRLAMVTELYQMAAENLNPDVSKSKPHFSCIAHTE